MGAAQAASTITSAPFQAGFVLEHLKFLLLVFFPPNNAPKLSGFSHCEQVKEQTPCLEAEMISRTWTYLPWNRELPSQRGNPTLSSWLLMQLSARVFDFVTKIPSLRPSGVTFWRSTHQRDTQNNRVCLVLIRNSLGQCESKTTWSSPVLPTSIFIAKKCFSCRV